MFDQGIFASTNFALNVLFARWLSVRDYGIYSVSFSFFLFLAVIHWATVIEPLIVQAARVEADRVRAFALALVKAHGLLLLAIAGLCCLGFVAANLLGARQVGWQLLCAGIGGNMVLTLLTARRLCLVFFSARMSALFGLGYCLGVVLSAALLHRLGDISWFEVWMIMGGWSGAAALAIFGHLYRRASGDGPFTLGDLFRFQSTYARWGIFSALFYWLRGDALLLILAQSAGVEALAQTRVVATLCNPLLQVNAALNASWLVRFPTVPVLERGAEMRRKLVPYASVGLALVVVTALIYRPLVTAIFGTRYAGAAWLLPVLYLANVLGGLETFMGGGLKAWGALRSGYLPHFISSVVALALGSVLIPRAGIVGLAYCSAATGALGAALALWVLWVHLRGATAAVEHP
ncbi:MAG: hypothetical protein JOY66_23845 [Acetobacteraceae bacterium]|nr:hypothetical protein [Acetobacteraceae bacterium]